MVGSCAAEFTLSRRAALQEEAGGKSEQSRKDLGLRHREHSFDPLQAGNTQKLDENTSRRCTVAARRLAPTVRRYKTRQERDGGDADAR